MNEQRTGSRPRLPGLINTMVVGVVVSLVAAVALTTRQTPPPTVAEFAPQAVEQ
ncbi:MAG: flagellar biosynthesis protein FliQ, partial [Glaciecola sp.]